eukprot:CAMPEP_0168564558 /NCGR_PEP_ID=MMETSP0413-20121227/13316_1 /TAXON_ID=136452 /ORGANISM="Filamoeba nolandi, Strain NC-AS-23-1" /LENGTH=244 /DNA_ID=CAMNT_0008596251 /DNA_START=12 /DNA_END=743 /DNA_ORIENTATION=+
MHIYENQEREPENRVEFHCLAELFEVDKDQGEQHYAAVDESLMWPKDTVILVYFLDGDPQLQKEVMQVVSSWNEHACVTFSACTKLDDSHIRVTFQGTGYHSLLGTRCLNQKWKGKPTMTLAGLERASTQEKKRHVLHEFGHALGLVHEHQSPSKPIPWNDPAVYQYYAQFGWNWQKVKSNVLAPLKDTNYSAFDPKSIMLYPILKELLDKHHKDYPYFASLATTFNCELSDQDKSFFAEYHKK